MVDDIQPGSLRAQGSHGTRAHPPQTRPMAISHRGAHDRFPENSIPAFQRALDLGAEGIELDVHVTRDNVLVVHHDPELQNGKPISGITYDALSRNKLAAGIGIPRLIDVLDIVKDRAVVFIEAKAKGIEMPLLNAVRSGDAECAIHSFDAETVRNIKRFFPAMRVGILTSGPYSDALRRLSETGADDLWHSASDIESALVTAVHHAGKRVIAWTSNEREEWNALSNIGVDGVCTDDIAAFAANS